MNDDTRNEDAAELNRNVVLFCATILSHFQDVLNEREKVICKLLVNGQSMLSVAKLLNISKERVRQIYWKSIRKIEAAYKEAAAEIEELREENESLKRRNYILENELLSAKSLENVDNLLAKEPTLCRNAGLLMNAPIHNLPLPARVINALSHAGVETFGDIPLFSTRDLETLRNCGRKAIVEIQNYLDKFSLRPGMTHKEIIAKLSTLSDEDIPTEDLQHGLSFMNGNDISSFIMTEKIPVEITLDDICAEIGSTRKSKKKWSRLVKSVLDENNLDSLEKLLALTPSEFKRMRGVGPTTLQHLRKAMSKFGIVWSDVPKSSV